MTNGIVLMINVGIGRKIMKAKELKELYFKDFINWLNRIGIGDHFSMDVWMMGVWNILRSQYEKEVQLSTFINSMKPDDLQKIVDEKRAIIKANEKNKTDSNLSVAK